MLPGVGDVIGSALGLYVVVVAFKRKLPLVTVARMLLNLGVDALVGAVPIAGDLFDVAWKANRRNVKLLRARHEARRDTAGDWLRVGRRLSRCSSAALARPVAALRGGWCTRRCRSSRSCQSRLSRALEAGERRQRLVRVALVVHGHAATARRCRR